MKNWIISCYSKMSFPTSSQLHLVFLNGNSQREDRSVPVAPQCELLWSDIRMLPERELTKANGREMQNTRGGRPGERRLETRILLGDSITWSVAPMACSKYECMIQSKGEETIARHVFLHDSQAKGSFYVFKWLGKKSKEKYYLMTHGNYTKFKLQCL